MVRHAPVEAVEVQHALISGSAGRRWDHSGSYMTANINSRENAVVRHDIANMAGRCPAPFWLDSEKTNKKYFRRALILNQDIQYRSINLSDAKFRL